MAPAPVRTQTYRDRLKTDKEKYERFKEKEKERSRKKREEERKKLEVDTNALEEKRKKDAVRQQRRREKLKKIKLAECLEQGLLHQHMCHLKEKAEVQEHNHDSVIFGKAVEEEDPLRIDTEDSSSVESGALDLIKEEDPRWKVKLESELIIIDED